MLAKYVKSCLDMLLAVLLLALLSPVLLLLAVIIKLDSRGPVFFKQKRAGLNRQPFYMYKFRSMVDNAEQLQGGLVTASNSPYITRSGHFLRLSSLDELPQLYNIVRGEMSLVGPRPLLPESILPAEERRLSVKPGITGLVQVSGRQSLEWEERMRLDLVYVDTWTFRRDLKILLQTVPTVLAWENVYDTAGESTVRLDAPLKLESEI